jgi:hypothetical protein
MNMYIGTYVCGKFAYIGSCLQRIGNVQNFINKFHISNLTIKHEIHGFNTTPTNIYGGTDDPYFESLPGC